MCYGLLGFGDNNFVTFRKYKIGWMIKKIMNSILKKKLIIKIFPMKNKL